jgi:excisionase family DNA binding protein
MRSKTVNGTRQWLTSQEASEYLQIHQETIRRWAREGLIPSVKLGNRGGFRFKREDLEQFLDSRRHGLK